MEKKKKKKKKTEKEEADHNEGMQVCTRQPFVVTLVANKK